MDIYYVHIKAFEASWHSGGPALTLGEPVTIQWARTVDPSLAEFPQAVLCGSFRRDQSGVIADYQALIDAGCGVLSPTNVRFGPEEDGFVYTEADAGRNPEEIEANHLRCIRSADFVWLHAPDGYVGQSASLEVGFAHAVGVPVFCHTPPTDVVMQSFVTRVSAPAEAVVAVSGEHVCKRGQALRALQDYYALAAVRRGYTDESPQDAMLLLTEEVGELARAIRKHVGLVRHGSYENESVGEELADVQLYLVHIANILNVDLASSVSRKDQRNAARHRAMPMKRTA
jgi:NTP pyrophosphatase (non-canonical NTP hydrolase)